MFMIVYVSFFEIDYGFEKCLWYVVIKVRSFDLCWMKEIFMLIIVI